MARGIALWVVGFLFCLLGAAYADEKPENPPPPPLAKAAQELANQLEKHKDEKLPVEALVELELAIDWRTDCKFAGAPKSAETDACRLSVIKTASAFLSDHRPLNDSQAEALAQGVGLLLDQEATDQPQVLAGLLVEATSDLVKKKGDKDIADLKSDLGALSTALGATIDGSAARSSTSDSENPADTGGRPGAKTAGQQPAEKAASPEGDEMGVRALRDKILAATDEDLENKAVQEALSNLRPKIASVVGCDAQQCHLTRALNSITSLITNLRDAAPAKSLTPSQAVALNKAARPLFAAILEANKKIYVALLLRGVKAIKSPDNKVKADLKQMRGLVASLLPAEKQDAKINILAAFFGDLGGIEGPDRGKFGFEPGDRYCWAFRAVATACHGRQACMEKSAAGDAKLEIDPKPLCGYDPVPYAEDSRKGLVVIYSCGSNVDAPVNELRAIHEVRGRLRALQNGKRPNSELVAFFHPGQSGGIRCSGVSAGDTAKAASQ